MKQRKERIVATIEARMGSSRLPGKVLLPVLGQPILYYLLRRLQAVRSIDEIVIATSWNSLDQAIVTFAKSVGVSVYRGSEHNVMNRVIGAGEFSKADVIVEITADCPIIDPIIVEQAIELYRNSQAEYVSNCVNRTYPDGMDTQVFKLDTLKKSAAMTNNPLDREHVTTHIRRNAQLFSHAHLIAPREIRCPSLRLTLDEEADYQLLRRIIKYFEPDQPMFTCQNVVRLLAERADWISLNAHIVPRMDR